MKPDDVEVFESEVGESVDPSLPVLLTASRPILLSSTTKAALIDSSMVLL